MNNATSLSLLVRRSLSSQSRFIRLSAATYGWHERLAVNSRENYHTTSVQFKKEAKKGKHLENMNQIGRASSRKEAKERRNKKRGKDRSAEGASQSSPQTSETDFLLEEEAEEELELEEQDENVLPDPSDVEDRMMKIVASYEVSLKSIRGSEPTPEIFEGIFVSAYGSNTPLNAVAQVVIDSSTLARATCYDPDLATNVSNAIRDKLELNPSVEDGGIVKIPLPRISLDVREQTVKTLSTRTENSRKRIRTIRRNALKIVKQGEAGKLDGVSKDDAFRTHKDIESATEKVMSRLQEAHTKKQEAVMAV